MKIAVCSDLHLEFGDITLKNEEGADVLILSGDIVIANDMHDHPPVVTNPYAPYINLGTRQECSYRFRDFFVECRKSSRMSSTSWATMSSITASGLQVLSICAKIVPGSRTFIFWNVKSKSLTM